MLNKLILQALNEVAEELVDPSVKHVSTIVDEEAIKLRYYIEFLYVEKYILLYIDFYMPLTRVEVKNMDKPVTSPVIYIVSKDTRLRDKSMIKTVKLPFPLLVAMYLLDKITDDNTRGKLLETIAGLLKHVVRKLIHDVEDTIETLISKEYWFISDLLKRNIDWNIVNLLMMYDVLHGSACIEIKDQCIWLVFERIYPCNKSLCIEVKYDDWGEAEEDEKLLRGYGYNVRIGDYDKPYLIIELDQDDDVSFTL